MLKLNILRIFSLLSCLVFRPGNINAESAALTRVTPNARGLQRLLAGLFRRTFKFLLIVLFFLGYLFMVGGTQIILAIIKG